MVVCTHANVPGAQKQTYHVSNRVPPASSSRSKILFAKEKPNMEKMFDGGVLCFQASSTSELKSKFTDESDSESSEWDPDA